MRAFSASLWSRCSVPPPSDSSQQPHEPDLASARHRAVLYLDYDGVLHHEDVRWRPRVGAYMHATGFRLFEHANLLEELLRPFPELRIVLSTSWVMQYGCSKAAKRLPKGLRERVTGATFHSEMDRRIFESLSRGRQVIGDVERRRPDNWFALDDTDEGWPPAFRERVVITHERSGIAPPNVVARIQANLSRMYPGLGGIAGADVNRRRT